MTVPRVTTYTWTLRPDLEVEVSDGPTGPIVYVEGVQHNISTIEDYILLLQDAVHQLHAWYPAWDGWSGEGDGTKGRFEGWGPLTKVGLDDLE